MPFGRFKRAFVIGGAAGALVVGLCAAAAPASAAGGSGVGPSFTYFNPAVVPSCQGSSSSVTLTDNWQASQANMTHTLKLDDVTVTFDDGAALTGADVHTFPNVTPGRHVAQFLSEDNNVSLPVVVCPTSLTGSSAVQLPLGASTVLSTTLTDDTTDTTLAGVTVKLYVRAMSGTVYHPTASATTDANGMASVSVTPATNAVYQWRFAGSSEEASTVAPAQNVYVNELVSIHALSDRYPVLGLWGGVAPNAAGRQVYLQAHDSTGWHLVAITTVRAQELGGRVQVAYVFRVIQRAATYRVFIPSTPANGTGISASLTRTP